MLTPEYLLHISEGAEEIAADLHTDIVKRIARRVLARQKRGDDYILTAADKWRIQSLLDAGYMQDDIAADIAKATNLEQSEIAEAFRDAGVTATKYDDKIYEAMGLPVGKQGPYYTRLMQRNYEATMGEWKNYTRTTADASQQVFINTMDEIYNRVATGSQSYTEAFTEAINKLAETGVIVHYPSGHRDTIETATLRCVRTGVSQASAQIQTARMDEYGVDLVLVSSHMGARPSHQVWQGKVYSRLGNSKKYPDFVSSTGYGTGAGLCGWNCRHNFSPYFEGMENPFEHYNKKENNELYEKTQKQRSMERAIRKSKREVEVLKDAAENAEHEETAKALREKAQKARQKLKKQTAAYYEYCDDNDLKPLPERLKIAQARRSVKTIDVEGRTVDLHSQYGNVMSDATNERITFTPAETIEEAQAHAQKFVSQYKSKYSGNVSYKGIDIDVANKANSVLEKIFSEYDIEPLRNITPMNMRENRWKNTTSDAAYQWFNGGDLFINPRYYKNKKTLEAHIKEGKDLLQQVLDGADKYIASGRAKPQQVEYLKALMTSKRQCVAQTHDYVESTIVHECGHMLDDKVFRKVLKEQGIDANQFLSASMEKYAMRISGYANSSGKEYIAECFAAYWNNETDILDPQIIKLFEDAKKWGK